LISKVFGQKNVPQVIVRHFPKLDKQSAVAIGNFPLILGECKPFVPDLTCPSFAVLIRPRKSLVYRAVQRYLRHRTTSYGWGADGVWWGYPSFRFVKRNIKNVCKKERISFEICCQNMGIEDWFSGLDLRSRKENIISE